MKGLKNLISKENKPEKKDVQEDKYNLKELFQRLGCTKNIAGSRTVK